MSAVLLVHSERDDRDTYGEHVRQVGFMPWCVREAVEALRRDPATRAIPIVVLTVCGWAEEEVRRAGCDAFLLKPCPAPVLVREIRRMLAVCAARPAEVACS
jgi:hypothetical protein